MHFLRNESSPSDGDELRSALEVIGGRGEHKEMVNLLLDMNTAGALASQMETINGVSVRVWSARKTEAFANDFTTIDELDAILVALFLDGEVVFTVVSNPQPQILWRGVVA